MSIITKQISFSYGKKNVIEQLNLQLNAGFNVLLGPNGAGKSTLFAMLTGLSAPKSGEIYINGFDLNKQSHNIMKTMGVVFQKPSLDIDLSVKQNLFYYAALHGISPKQALANISTILTQLKLSERLNDKVRSLNGGHRRRVEIARALIHQPKVLLLDEATVGLDIDSRKLITEYVRGLCQTLNICVLWTTHLIDEITPDDQLVILNQGKIKAQGSAKALVDAYQVNDVFQLYHTLNNTVEVV